MTDNLSTAEIHIEDAPAELEPADEATNEAVVDAPAPAAAADDPSLELYINAMATAEAVATRAANGDLEARITNTEEFGELAPFLIAINKLLDEADAYVRESKASLEFASQGKFYRPFLVRGMLGDFRRGAEVINTARETMHVRHDLTQEFQQTVSDVVSVFASAATELEATAGSMSDNAGTAHKQSVAVSSASEESATSANAVAASTEQLTASIGEIGRQTDQSISAAESVSEEVIHANASAKELIECSQKIEQVATFIKDIAGQTNLLALNATIESARAGEAGKGFAVVASEVKTLAGRVTDATADINDQINAIREASERAGTSIDSIDERIQNVKEVTTAIASAVQQQSAATAEISSNVQQAAEGAREISENINSISAVSEETGTGADQVLQAARELAVEANGLSDKVKDFLQKIEAA